MIPDQLTSLFEQANQAAQNNERPLAVEQFGMFLAKSVPYQDDPAVKEMRLRAWAERGRLMRELGDQEGALASYNQSYLEAGTSQQAVEALALLGDQYSQMGQHLKALEANQEALQLAEALNYTTGRAHALMRMGWTQIGLGRLEESLTSLNKAYSLFQQVEDKVGQLRSINRIGLAHMRQGQIDKAILALNRSLELSWEVGDRETAIELDNLGECYQLLFDMEQAMRHHQEGLAIAERIKLTALEADLCRNLGVDLYYLGRVEEGVAYLRRALFLGEEMEQPDVICQVLYSLAVAEVELGEVTAAREHGQRLKELAEKTNARGYLGDALYVLGLCHEQNGERAMAEQLWQQGLFLAHETNRRMLLWQSHSALSRISNNPSLKDVHNRIAAEVIQQIAFPIEDENLKQKFLNAPAVRDVLWKATG
jgi:tetratricopeptide (TPR) repeat protein